MTHSNPSQKTLSANCLATFLTFAKTLLLALSAVFLSIQMAFAVDVNRASLEELDTIKGIGAVKAQAIVTERNTNGPFKDANDLAVRVKGLGDKSVANLMQAGLTINGSNAAAKPVQNNQKQNITTIAPRATKNTANSAAVDFSAGQTSVTQNNNSAASTNANMPEVKTKSKEAKETKSTKMIIASQPAPSAAMPVQAIESSKATKPAKQGLPKATAEMTVKPAKEPKKDTKAAPANVKMMAAAKPAANQ